jgi:biotin operon repressor
MAKRDWDATEDALLIERWSAGVALKVIAEQLGRSRNSAAGRIDRLREEGHAIPYRNRHRPC